MCAYCNMGDHAFRWGSPFPTTHPLVPQRMPDIEQHNWPVERLREYLKLLREVKEIEDQVGCPCPDEREKPDYVKLFEDRIAELERRVGIQAQPATNPEDDGA